MDICRCCLSEGCSKNINETYVYFDKKEVYSEMFQECFNISLAIIESFSVGICDACVKALRSSLLFKTQVLQNENDFLNKIKAIADVSVKIEPETDYVEFGTGDALIDHPSSEYDRKSVDNKVYDDAEVIKGRESKKKKKTRRRENNLNLGKKRISVTRLSKLKEEDVTLASIKKEEDDCKLSELLVSGGGIEAYKKIKKTRKSGKNSLPYQAIINADTKISLKKSIERPCKMSGVTRDNTYLDKKKHKENLMNILKYSNATPFKNKSLLGYTCGYCNNSYPDPVDLRSHTETEHQEDRLNFRNDLDLAEYACKLDIENLKCKLCRENLNNLSSLKEHLKRVHCKNFHNDIKDHILQFRLTKGEVYNCTMCSSMYETFKMLQQHMNKHYTNYICTVCNSTFTTRRSLGAHRTTHELGSFKCDHCDKVFSSKTKKQYHEKSKHFGARNISNCPYCDEPFRSYYQRNLHLVKVHNTEAQYKCNVCEKSYILKSLLMYHIKKNHLMEKNFQCTQCGYKFFSKKALNAHMVKHTGERNYTCDVCHKSYARKYTLREHMRIHNNDRRFKCSVCGMCFVQKCSLRSHLLSNHGISMAACDIKRVSDNIEIIS